MVAQPSPNPRRGVRHNEAVTSRRADHRGRLLVVLVLSGTVLVAEVVGALLTGSLALLADAGHMGVDVVGVGLALFAMTVATRPASSRRTYGYYRLEIMAALVNAVLIFGVAAYVGVEAVRRLGDPPAVAAVPMMVIGALGLSANAVGLGLLHHRHGESLNVRGAYLEVLGDFIGSGAVLAAAIVIATTGWRYADPAASVVIGVLVLPRTWLLLREAVDVLLEATPKGVDLDEVRAHLLEADGVVDVHDLHAWTITSGMPVLSAHVVVAEQALADNHGGQVLDGLAGCLTGHFDIDHCTFQLEPAGHVEHEYSCRL